MRLSLPIAALIALATVAIVLLYAWQTWAGWVAENREVIRETTNLAESISQQAGASFDETDAVLQRMYFWAAARGVSPPQRQLLRDLLRVRTPSMGDIRTLAFLDLGGRAVVRSDAPRDTAEIPGARAAWGYHKGHASLEPTVGEPLQDRVTGRWTLTVSRRFNDPRDRFAGIVLATVSVLPLERLISSVDIGRDGAMGLYLDSGTIVLRRAPGGWVIGAHIPGNPLPALLRNATSAEYTTVSPFDGRKRLTAFRRVDRYPLIVAVGVSLDEAFAAWRNVSIAGLAGVCAVIGVIGLLVRFLVREIRLNARAQEQLAEFALSDGLTGLANRRQFDIAIERECRVADRDATQLALLMIDVDIFKTFNDRYGHQRGDDVLKAVADCVRANCVRPSDVAARYGGEEFAAILPATPPDGAQQVAENIQAALLARRLVHADNASGFVTISIGVAARLPGLSTMPAAIVGAADAALYAAKRNGRNRIEFAAREPSVISPRT